MNWAEHFAGNATIAALLAPERLYTAFEAVARVDGAPKKPGIYAWYFDTIPPGINASTCHTVNGWSLLYIGISPKKPPSNGRAPSKSHIHKRLCTHFAGNASVSTLRLTLGCLLDQEIGTTLRRVRIGTQGQVRLTFTTPGEQFLKQWMCAHARIAWAEHFALWKPEEALLASGLPLPLNIHGNSCTAFIVQLKALRNAARRRAEILPLICDSNKPRRSKTGQI